MMTGLIETLRKLHADIAAHGVVLAADENPLAGVYFQISGHLMICEGLARGMVRPMRLVRDDASATRMVPGRR